MVRLRALPTEPAPWRLTKRWRLLRGSTDRPACSSDDKVARVTSAAPAEPARSVTSPASGHGTDQCSDHGADDLTAPLLDPAFYAGDPFPLYARLRAEAPVTRNPTLGFWVASRHAEVTAVSRDPDTFCSGKGVMGFDIGREDPTPPSMMHTDPPDHTRYRALVQPGFRPPFIRGLEDGVRARARTLVDRDRKSTRL